jgi:hypothetical protein
MSGATGVTASSFDVSHGLLLIIGAFYAFAGFVGIRAALHGRLFDIALASISMTPTPKAELARGLWLLVGSLIVLAGGLFLLLRLKWAAWAFAASAGAQALYLLLIASKLLDPNAPPDATGRQQTINAFILYAAATAFVLWAYRTGRLMPAYAAGWPYVWTVLCVLAVAMVYGLIRFFYSMAKGPTGTLWGNRDGSGGDAVSTGSEEEPPRPLSESGKIVVMAEYECDPLWAHDPDLSGAFSPRDLPLSESLMADLEAWAMAYSGSFNMEELANPHWSEEQYKAHRAVGLKLARRLKRELPDRQIYVWDFDSGHTEVSAGQKPDSDGPDGGT